MEDTKSWYWFMQRLDPTLSSAPRRTAMKSRRMSISSGSAFVLLPCGKASKMAGASGPVTSRGKMWQYGHLNCDSVIRAEKKPGSNILLTDRTRFNCLTCAESKQTRNVQPQKDTGTHSPIDQVGGVIYSDIKGPISPAD